MTEDEMVGWHQRLNGHEFEQALGDGEGQGSLVPCSARGRTESDTNEELNNSNRANYKRKTFFLKRQSIKSRFRYGRDVEIVILVTQNIYDQHAKISN